MKVRSQQLGKPYNKNLFYTNLYKSYEKIGLVDRNLDDPDFKVHSKKKDYYCWR